MMSATCAKPSVRSRWRAALGENDRQRVVALDAAVGEVVRRRVGAEDERRRAPTSARAASRRAGARAAPGIRPRMALVDLLQRQPAVLLHQVDEPEVARAEHDDLAVGDVVLRPRLARSSRAGRLAERVPDHRRLLVAAGDVRRRRRRSSERSHQVVEPVAVALLEGRALGLAVVGEDDDLVRAAARSGARARCGRTAGRACAAPPACRRAPARSGGRPRRSSRTSRRRRAGRASCR